MQPLPPGDLTQLVPVGSGGFGVVYKGRSARLGMDIVLKRTHRESASDFESLMKEKDMMSRANYTYVLRLLGLYEIEGRTLCKYGLVMEYMPYGSVSTLFERIKNVPWALRFQILHQVALGMNYLHHVLEPPIIHRDLKPHNVLLNKSLDVQLTDFGLAKNEASVSSNLSMVGTLSYMPPEALESVNYKPTKEFDVYSFAILTWSVLSGQEPYEDANKHMIKLLVPKSSKHRPELKLVNQWKSQKMVPEAVQLMQECWEADPGKRPTFSVIVKRTYEMNDAYTGEIHNEILTVLDQLKHNPSHSQNLDNRDGGTTSNSKPSIPDSDSFNVSAFRKVLQEAERRGANVDNRSVSPEISIRDIADAEGLPRGHCSWWIAQGSCSAGARFLSLSGEFADFLRSNLAHIVQAKPDLSNVLDVLFSKRTVTQEELDTIRDGPIQEQIRKTLFMIKNKGPESCMEFLQLMNQHHPELMASLAHKSRAT